MTSGAGEGAIVAEDSVFTGKVRGQHLTVLGTLEGEVVVAGRLSVGKKGRVKAAVKAAEVTVEGEIDGEIRADRLILTETARARGTFIAGHLVVKEGAFIDGAVNPPDTRTTVPEPVKVAPILIAPARDSNAGMLSEAGKTEGQKAEEPKPEEKKG